MHREPHETPPRTTAWSKDPAHERWFEALNATLAGATLPAPEATWAPATLPLIFVVGLPRSGNTVFHQLLCRHFRLGWIDNLAARFWLRPSVGIALSRSFGDAQRRAGLDLESRHGTTRGVHGPHEFGYFWRHWLELDAAGSHYLTPAERSRVDTNGLRHALEQEILAAFDAPVALRNPICGLNAELISYVHPKSLFVRMMRDPLDVARSILRCRKERYGRWDAWWSLKPSTWPFETNDPVEQVALQVRDSIVDLDRELARPGISSLSVSYEHLVADPEHVLDRVEQQCDRLEHVMERLPHPAPQLGTGPVEQLPRDFERRLLETFNRLGLDSHREP